MGRRLPRKPPQRLKASPDCPALVGLFLVGVVLSW
jgi:hypothetical protein